MNNKVQVNEVKLQLDSMLGNFGAVLPKHIPVERFGRVVLMAVQTNPDLLNVERRSLWNACMRAAQDGLLPDGRLGALVVYKDKRRGPIAQWMPMIAGLRQKVRNSGEVASWDVHVVHEKDFFDYRLGDDERIEHRPVLRGDRGRIIAAYSIATLRGGEKSRDVMTVDEIEKIRAMSKAPGSSAWTEHYGEMCKKTVARRHSKVLPMSSDLDDLLRRDDDENHPQFTPGESAEPAPKRSLSDALNMIASLPESREPTPDEFPGDIPLEHDSDGVIADEQGDMLEQGRSK